MKLYNVETNGRLMGLRSKEMGRDGKKPFVVTTISLFYKVQGV